MEKIGIIDYGLGNLGSVKNALAALDAPFEMVEKAEEFGQFRKLILPGVGNFRQGMANLSSLGFLPKIHEHIQDSTRLLLGICLGFQMLFQASEEGDAAGLGILPNKVKSLKGRGSKVPHIGWNETHLPTHTRLFGGLTSPADFYYVHSYAVIETELPGVLAGKCDYGGEFLASVESENVFGVQFHPEKSQGAGMQMLENFTKMPCR